MAARSIHRFGLARTLSKLGFCSRSQAAELIRSGRVTVNGLRRRDPDFPVDVERDQVCVDGAPVRTSPRSYFMLNKPRGVVTTASDERGRSTVMDLLPADGAWTAPVGRLDKSSEGLLLLTNDSEWAARILDPTSHLDKTYHVQVRVQPEEALLKTLLAGVRCDSSALLRVKSASVIRHGRVNSWLEIRLDEGRNRQIRRIFEALDIEVLRLVRVAIGPLTLGTLAKGAVRKLTSTELQSVARALKSARTAGSPDPSQIRPKVS